MFRNAYQRGLLTIFYAAGADPLSIWEVHNEEGYFSKFLDPEIRAMVLDIGANNISTTYITCPKGKMTLGITLPFLVLIVKNLKKYFSFEVTILDESNARRRFRASNFQSVTQIMPLCTAMPVCLADGWNQIQFNLAEFTRRAYNKQFIEVQSVKINANIRIRRIYFAERLLPDSELPVSYKLFFPIKGPKGRPAKKEAVAPPALPPVSAKLPSKTGSVHSVKVEVVQTEAPPAEAPPAEVTEDAPAAPEEAKPAEEVEVKTEPGEGGEPSEPTAEGAAEVPAEGGEETPGDAPAEPPAEAAEAVADAPAGPPAEPAEETPAE